MKRWIALALICSAALAHAQTTQSKKDLVAKLLQTQRPAIEEMAKMIAERPVMQLLQQAGAALQQLPPDKREATGKSIQADAKKFVDEAVPVVRDDAIKIAPATVGAIMEEKFTEDELKQLIAWNESPVKKKYDEFGGEMQSALVKQLLTEAGTVLDPKLKALQQKIGDTLRAAAASSSGGPASVPKSTKPVAPSSKASAPK